VSLDRDRMRAEAESAWREETRRVAIGTDTSALVLALAVLAGALTLALVSMRLASAGAIAASALGAALALAIGTAPIAIVLLRVRGARRVIERARVEANVECPRCAASIAAAADRCAGCDAILGREMGLVIAYTSDAAWRRRRLRAQARLRLRGLASGWALSPLVWISLSIVALAIVWASQKSVEGGGLAAIPFGPDRESSMPSIAFAEPEGIAPPPPGPQTRPFAPLWVATLALARTERSPYHELAVIVRVDPPRALVVYASGGSRWVYARELLAPELAPGDAVEVWDGSRFQEATLRQRVGSAVRVRSPDGSQRWTSDANLRVRSDAAHRAGEGLESEVPPGAWVEARIGGVLRPGIAVDVTREEDRLLVAMSDGTEIWIPQSGVRSQAIGPGVEVFVDGWPRPLLVAARIGHALAVVGEDGSRSWTSLARVRRRP
jgi:hypothetical protein